MEATINNAVAEALASKVTEQVAARIETAWSTVVQELASTRRTNEHFIRILETYLSEKRSQNGQIDEKLAEFTAEIEKTRENNQKTARILDEIINDLAIEG
jgi:protein involved in ribonucleotide reduction